MDDIRKVIDEMKGEENTLLKIRTTEAQTSARNATTAIIGGTLAAFVVLALAGFHYHAQHCQSAPGKSRPPRNGSPWAT